MADIRINALATTATSSASDDYVAIDGSANGTRKLSAYSPTFGGNLVATGTLTVNSTTDSSSKDTGAIITEGGLGVEKSASIGGALTVNGAIISTLGNNTTIFNSASATTGYQVFNLQNTSGRLQFGLEASTGGNLITGSTAYATCLTTIGNKPVQIGVDQALIGSFSSTGLAITGALSSTGNLTVSGTGNSTFGGNVGLGITPSSWANTWKVIDLGTYSGVVGNEFNKATDLWNNSYYNGTSTVYKTSAYAAVYRITAQTGDHEWYTAPSGTAGATASFSNRMTLTNGGNLLLGPTTDAGAGYKLQIEDGSGASRISIVNTNNAASGSGIYLQTKSSGTLVSNATLRTGNNGSFQIYTGTSSEALALTLDSSQNATFAGTVATTGPVTSSGAGYTNSGFKITNTSASRTTGWFLTNSGVSALRDVTGAADLFDVDLGGNGTFRGWAAVKDGVTAPSATSGYAKIYVDTADGDLKVIFGDGTVKTIVTDS